MNNISNDVSRHAVAATQIIGMERVRSILGAHFADRVSNLKVGYVDGFLRELKRAVDEALLRKPCEAPEARACGESSAPAAPTVQDTIDFKPLYAAVMEAEDVIGYEAVRETLRSMYGVSVPSLLRVQDVATALLSLREAVAAATPTRKQLREFLESAEVTSDGREALEAFVHWIDSKPASTAPADKADSEWVNRYHR